MPKQHRYADARLRSWSPHGDARSPGDVRRAATPRETAWGPALCNVAIGQMRPLVVPDTLADERFARNTFVTGEPHLRFYAGAPLRTPEGHAIDTLCAMDVKPRAFPPGAVQALTDLAGIVTSELELRRVAATDGLTGALSRRAFQAVNDGHGHTADDRVLRAAADSCRTLLRASDVLGRMGGEEFAILLPLTGRTAAVEVAEKICAAFAE